MTHTLAYKLLTIGPMSLDHCDVGVTIPEFQTPEDTPLVSVNALIEEMVGDIVETFLEMESESPAAELKELGLPKDGLWIQPIVLTATPSLISVELYIATQRSGMQRSHYTRTLNVDVENCRELLLADMIEDRASATLFFSKYCEEALKAHWDVAHLAKWKLDMSGASASQSIGFRNTDMIVIFAPHYVGSHAIGRALVEIPFNAASRFLTDRIIELWIGPHRNTDPI